MSDPAQAGGVRLSATQLQRLRELGGGSELAEATFADAGARDAAFRAAEDEITRAGRRHLKDLKTGSATPRLLNLEAALRAALGAAGFVPMVTPLIISAESLTKMGIEHGHPLRDQVFWLEDGRCLRPMLAPNLYTMLRRLGRMWGRPFGIYEIGPCFRMDTKGSTHLNEFTMLNLVELGTPEGRCRERMTELAALVMDAAGVEHYELVKTESEVYGQMVDVEVNGMEVCSAGMGPHPLDGNWGIVDPWVGLGFGLERLIMARERFPNIERAGRSLSYYDGIRLNI